jgi:hypothetical protein
MGRVCRLARPRSAALRLPPTRGCRWLAPRRATRPIRSSPRRTATRSRPGCRCLPCDGLLPPAWWRVRRQPGRTHADPRRIRRRRAGDEGARPAVEVVEANRSTSSGGQNGTHHKAESARSYSRDDGPAESQSQKATSRSPSITALYGARILVTDDQPWLHHTTDEPLLTRGRLEADRRGVESAHHRPTWTRVDSVNTQLGHGSLLPTVSPGRKLSISWPGRRRRAPAGRRRTRHPPGAVATRAPSTSR